MQRASWRERERHKRAKVKNLSPWPIHIHKKTKTKEIGKNKTLTPQCFLNWCLPFGGQQIGESCLVQRIISISIHFTLLNEIKTAKWFMFT